MSDVRVRLTIDVDYTLNGTDVSDLCEVLRSIPREADRLGNLTGQLPAQMDRWNCRVELAEDYVQLCGACQQRKTGWPNEWGNVPIDGGHVRYVCKGCVDHHGRDA